MMEGEGKCRDEAEARGLPAERHIERERQRQRISFSYTVIYLTVEMNTESPLIPQMHK